MQPNRCARSMMVRHNAALWRSEAQSDVKVGSTFNSEIGRDFIRANDE